ncbi:MAG: glycoside hydrolase family 1 protein [Anaerolineae bacterium]
MPDRILKFPDGFLWGSATSAHQTEGENTNNDFWAWEQEPGRVADGTNSGLACDWWRRAEEDFDRAAALGHNTLRLSLEWSRLEPEPGRWDEAAVDRYREMLVALRQRGIEPMLTLHHFTNPLWLAGQGGWLAPNIVPLFERYAGKAARWFGDLCRLWCTINEPMVYAVNAYLVGIWFPGRTRLRQAFQVAANMARAHGAAYQALRRERPGAQVGLAKHIPYFDPAGATVLDGGLAAARDLLFNRRFLEAVTEGRLKPPLGWGFGGRVVPQAVDSVDFLGLNYYGGYKVTFDARSPSGLFSRHVIADHQAEMWDAPWADREISPGGLYRCLKRLAAYGKPIFIAENGLDDAQDRRRPRFLLAHLAAVHRAIREGVDVRGFYHWTLVDNYEWVEGWTTRFGLIALDPETQARAPRRSAEMYAAIARANAISEELVAGYAPEAVEDIFAA